MNLEPGHLVTSICARSVAETTEGLVVTLDSARLVTLPNRSYGGTSQLGPREGGDRLTYWPENRRWDFPEFRKPPEDIVSRGTCVRDIEVEPAIRHAGPRTMPLNASPNRREPKAVELAEGFSPIAVRPSWR